MNFLLLVSLQKASRVLAILIESFVVLYYFFIVRSLLLANPTLLMQHIYNEALALEIATALKDMDGYSSFLSFTYNYPEEFLRKQLKKALEYPEEKIKRNRAALFTHLVQQRDTFNRNNLRNKHWN